MKKIGIVCDSLFLLREIRKILNDKEFDAFDVVFFHSYLEDDISDSFLEEGSSPINIREKEDVFWRQFDLVLSLHSRQIFPEKMIKSVRCVNVHPGYNPENRGWYPHVFSMINGKNAGVTIHEIDGKVDHGPIIYREAVEIKEDDTSLEVYNKIQEKEAELLRKHLKDLFDGNYDVFVPSDEGNINYKKDFRSLCAIDLEKEATFGEVIDYLRAMTFGEYKNAYYCDKDGKKIFVRITLEKEL